MISSASNTVEYENTPAMVIATRKIPLIETAGITIKEAQEGREFTVPYWVARVLQEAGLVRFSEEAITMEEWTQIHFKERLNPAGPISGLAERFYPRAHISLTQIPEEQLNRVRARYRDIVESRIGRVVRMASAEVQSPTRAFQREELELYEELSKLITMWRMDIRGLGEKR